jgi:hypothetical protein
MMETALRFIIDAFVFSVCLWLAMYITSVKGSFRATAIIVAVSSLLGLVPFAGWILSLVVMFVLICKLTDAELWPDAVLMVVVAQFLATLAGALVLGALGGTIAL